MQVSEEEGGTLEQIFTQAAVDLLADAGETENVRVAYDEGQLGTKNQHKINAYAEPDNYEDLDPFFTVFNGADEPARVPKDEVDPAAKRIANFYNKAISRHYVDDIEEASQIWEFARTSLQDQICLTKVWFGLTRSFSPTVLYSGAVPPHRIIAGCPVFFRVVDLDYLFNITQKSHVPVEIDFRDEGFDIPCIVPPPENDSLSIVSGNHAGTALATIYERFGSRLLEQNVRSFLQFTGKVNKGIRQTILDEPHMFLAFQQRDCRDSRRVFKLKKLKTGTV